MWFDDHENDDQTADQPQPSNLVSVQPAADSIEAQFAAVIHRDVIDAKMGFSRYVQGTPKKGWLVNIQPTILDDGVSPLGRSGVELYFLEDDGDYFKATVLYEPYFYVVCKSGTETDVEEYIKRKYRPQLLAINVLKKDDLTLPNHLLGNQRSVLKLSFHNESHHLAVRRGLASIAERNSRKSKNEYTYDGDYNDYNAESSRPKQMCEDPADCILELREYDILYYMRVAIDCNLRVGMWYDVAAIQGKITIVLDKDKITRADPVVLAFDIETTKLPLKFPDSAIDSIMMISYMIDGQGYLITNREIVSKDIDDFEFTPKPEYQGSFVIFNEINEKAVIERFYEHIETARPTIISTYNGDYFDWPFLEARSKVHGIDMKMAIGFSKNASGEYLSSSAMHLDCFYWVKRDSYLPQGSQGLKAVATYKLGYNPIELDPEDMTRFAIDKPQELAQYSVSDAVATYYLYMKYVHPFIFSLCNVIPMNPDDVLRRGSGTLCEHLLMVESFKANVIIPNKHVDAQARFHENHLLSSETYVGGHVEALEAGVFRSDLPIRFKLIPEAFRKLIDEIDNALQFSIQVECQTQLDEVTNYDQVRSDIVDALTLLHDTPIRMETPSIYHLDVAAMYPNIILTNRLQPDAIVDEDVCATCDFNEGADSSCRREMPWSWRGEYFTAKRGEYNMIVNQLEQEKFPGKFPSDPSVSYHDLPKADQTTQLKKRLGEYSRKVYGKAHATKVVEKNSIVCQRENPFYINTVREFRDRRYIYKGLLKQWKKKLDAATNDQDAIGVDEAQKMVVIFDSLQTAHKCILNSFYGYVMRKGARWYSMEMAGIVCLTGAKIIQLARSRVEQVGRPLELDTDGIWCMLPASFPESFTFELKNGKQLNISYPCVMLNHLVHDQFTNHQYQERNALTEKYSMRSENSIFFEVDGPYRAMILPASTEEDKLLKKRYAVFNHDGTLAELKGFEVKRRGELKLVKNFQSSIFKVFLEGETLEQCYAAVAVASNRWLDILYSKGADLTDSELFDLVSENRSMSKSLEEYGSQKSTSITTAKRLAEFLGQQMVRDKGLNCKFIIACKPVGLNVSERAIPVAIFQAEPAVCRHFLRKWLKDNSIVDAKIRDIIDWDYYMTRFGSVIQKLITIPAAMQNIENPIPRVHHPDWLAKRLLNRDDKTRQLRITDMFKPVEHVEKISEIDVTCEEPIIADVEDLYRKDKALLGGKRRFGTAVVKRRGKPKPKVKKNVLPAGIDPYVDYPGWLVQQRTIWRELIRKRSSSNTNVNVSGIKSYFESTSTNILQNIWQVLHLAETDTPGVFRVWAIVSGSLQSMLFDIPRVVYLNSKVSDTGAAINQPGIQMIKRMRTLPRNRQVYNLYEMRMTETFYREHASMFASMFNHKDVEGVYESQIAPLFRALLHFGCFGQLRQFNHQLDINSCLEMDDLLRIQRPSSQYLPKNSFQMFYLFIAKTGSRQVWGLFIPSNNTIEAIVVDPGMNRDAVPSLKRTYSEIWANKFGQSIVDERVHPPDAEVNTIVCETENDAISAMNRLLSAFKDSTTKPYILGIQASGGQQHLRSIGLTSICEFPSMHILCHKADSILPAVGWQTFASKRMMEHFLNMDEIVSNRIDLSRYGNVPICNIEADYTLFLSDLFLARKLVKADMILWCSPSSKPDLGGSEQDDNRSDSDLKYPELNTPGTFDCVSIELSMYDLALNTLIQSFGQQAELDNSIVTGGAIGQKNVLLDGHFTNKSDNNAKSAISLGNTGNNDSLRSVLVIIRSMVKGWLEEVQKQNMFASHLLEHFHRWISSSSALLGDPMIVSHIHNLMTQSFHSLLSEFRRLGCKIIYASFDKIVLATSKMNMKSGVGYVTYLIAALGKNPQFEHLELTPLRFWDWLLWMDTHNYGGIQFQDENDRSNNDSEDSAFKIDMKWNISEYLPVSVHNSLQEVIIEFINTIKTLKSKGASIEESIGAIFSSSITRRMFQLVGEMKKKCTITNMDEDAADWTIFPSLPGSCRKLLNPSLEFIAMVTTIFSLEKFVGNEVRVLRRDLLKMIGVKEFSNEANFKNPCERYVLPQVICEYCNYCCDLDLTRELEDNAANDDGSGINFLSCSGCGTSYDRDDIEQRLAYDLMTLICKWQLQDLKCKQCRMIKAEDLRENCASCTGRIVTVLDIGATKRRIGVLGNLAEFFKMDMLTEAVGMI